MESVHAPLSAEGGVPMVLSYIVQVMEGGNLLWDLASIKVDRLVKEIKILM